jgi:hypothetical protein
MQHALHNTNTIHGCKSTFNEVTSMRVFRATVGRTLLVIAVGFFLESVAGTGFTRDPRHPITMQVDQTFHLNATMEVGAVSHEVLVTSQAPIMQTEGYRQSLWLSPPESSQKTIRSALGPSIVVSEPIFDLEVSYV